MSAVEICEALGAFALACAIYASSGLTRKIVITVALGICCIGATYGWGLVPDYNSAWTWEGSLQKLMTLGAAHDRILTGAFWTCLGISFYIKYVSYNDTPKWQRKLMRHVAKLKKPGFVLKS